MSLVPSTSTPVESAPDRPGTLKSRGILMPIGGAEDKMKARRILNKFFTLASGRQAQIFDWSGH